MHSKVSERPAFPPNIVEEGSDIDISKIINNWKS